MERFFVNNPDNDHVIIDGEEARHLVLVLRKKPGDQFDCFDETGKEYRVRIEKIVDNKVIGIIINQFERNCEPHIQVTLFQGVPKGDKMDLIVQKCTELGISTIVPMITERTIVKWEEKKALQKQIRWQKIAKEAAKQSRRKVIPKIEPIISFSKAIEKKGVQEAFILWEDEHKKGLKLFLRQSSVKDKISFFVGPEGGFSETEISSAVKLAITPLTLGPRILRTETAGLAALTMILYELDDLGGKDG